MPSTGSPELVRRRIQIRGIVQGVGFRPFVYGLARGLGLTGYVLNSSAGVTIEIQGTDSSLREFLAGLRRNPPPLAQIEETVVSELEPREDPSFEIRDSQAVENDFVLVSPDIATCDDCWRDFGRPGDRRYGYAFTNCTNCGPRYTIIRDIPYDRPMTTMAPFEMCAECRTEYHDPANRRFHAQPNACPACGPSLALLPSGRPATSAVYAGHDSVAQIHAVREHLRNGDIVAVKGLGGFLLACDAANDSALKRLRERKRRSEKPFALMARDAAAVDQFCVVTPEERRLLESRRRPIVLLPRRAGGMISAEVAPGNATLGVMLPYTPLHYLLFGDTPDEQPAFTALVMTSGNFSEEPIVISNQEACARLAPVADWFLLHNRDIYMRADDSVTRIFDNRERVLRRSRGYVPETVDLGFQALELLACGAELKNTFCLTKGRYAILSQHIGDLDNYETLLFFQETLENLKKLFRVTPRAVAYDLHPLYMSSRFALESAIEPKIGVQHHHAHIASCMAENHLTGKVIGVAFDGTGYGSDGRVWGGEFLVADFAGFERHAHLRYVPLAGGDTAIREPWRAALSYLRDTFGRGELDVSALLRSVPGNRLSLVDTMLSRNVNCVESSSCGRLFDAVSSLIGIRQVVSYEGQAAIEMEAAVEYGIDAVYPFEIHSGSPMQIDVRPMISSIVRELGESKPAPYIAACFHNTVAEIIVQVCERISRDTGLSRVCLSGGTFQNMYLLVRAVAGLRRAGLEVFLHSRVPPNDGGICLGQAAIASELLKQGG